ncbi:MAG: dihydropteroate synthase [Bacteroidales bacterium]
MRQESFFLPKRQLNFYGKLFSIEIPWVMGIINITPDSFFDGGRYQEKTAMLKQAEKMLSEGADILDIGAMSSRPGAKIIAAEEEKQRLLPALQSLRKTFPKAILSVDTFRSEIAREAVDNGAGMINDISGGTMDELMFRTVAELNVPYVLMHMQGTPQNMQKNPQYNDVTLEVGAFFAHQLQKLKLLGVKDVILDPGLGFGKTPDHNFRLLKELHHFKIFELPLLLGLSRKSMLKKLLGTSPQNALNGTTALNVIALERGAAILRVHDVKEAKQAVHVVEKLHRDD